MNTWDLGYINRLEKESRHLINEDLYMDYFPAENIKLATMEIYE